MAISFQRPTRGIPPKPTRPIFGKPTRPIFGKPTRPIFGKPTRPVFGKPTRPSGIPVAPTRPVFGILPKIKTVAASLGVAPEKVEETIEKVASDKGVAVEDVKVSEVGTEIMAISPRKPIDPALIHLSQPKIESVATSLGVTPQKIEQTISKVSKQKDIPVEDVKKSEVETEITNGKLFGLPRNIAYAGIAVIVIGTLFVITRRR